MSQVMDFYKGGGKKRSNKEESLQSLLLLFSFEHRRGNLGRVRCIYFSSSSTACLLTLSDCTQKCPLQLNAEFSDNLAGFPCYLNLAWKSYALEMSGMNFCGSSVAVCEGWEWSRPGPLLPVVKLSISCSSALRHGLFAQREDPLATLK